MSSEIPEGKMKKERAKEKCTRTGRKFYNANDVKNTYPLATLIKRGNITILKYLLNFKLCVSSIVGDYYLLMYQNTYSIAIFFCKI